jgi:PEP-CTERM motif-containing protein
MRKIVPALAAAVIATIGASSAAHAAVNVINFAVGDFGGTLSFTGPTLESSTAFDLDGSTLEVAALGPTDNASGLTLGDTVAVSPTDIVYGAGSGKSVLPFSITKEWTASVAEGVTPVGDVFTETLTNVLRIDRTAPNAITVFLAGTVSDTAGNFTDVPAFLILQANQVGGPGTVISSSFTNTTVLGTVPEPATWVMMLLGFVGLGYAAVRRSAKDRPALAI